MTKKQWIIVGALGVLDLIVLVVIGYLIISSTSAARQASVATEPTETPRPTLPPTWTPRPTPTPFVQATPTPRVLSGDEVAMLEGMEQEIAELRGLDPIEPVTRTVLTQRQMQRRCIEMYSGEQWRETAEDLKFTLVAFDMMNPYQDLLSLWRRLYCEIVGYYDAENGEIYVITDGDMFGAAERRIYAHEFAHALQDQHYDLQGGGVDTTERIHEYADAVWAIRAVAEGDAGLVTDQYIELYFTPEDMTALEEESTGLSTAASDTLPRIVQEAFQFPYTYGREFVETLYEDDGWEAVNFAYYVDVPASTEQILHPERYLSGDQPITVTLPSLASTLDDEWDLVYDNPAGEFFLRLYLEQQLDAAEAAAAAEGWGGDLCRVYYDGGRQTVMTFRIAWDTPRDADEFVESYLAWAEARFGYPPSTSEGGTSCWWGDDALCLTWGDEESTIIRGPNQALVEETMAVLSTE